MYDVIIIGAGPAGLFTAYELSEKNKNLKILLLDKGKLAKNRHCPMSKNKIPCKNCNPCQIMSGYGGAGTFSDGKLNFIPKLGKSDLFKYMSESEANELINDTEKIFNKFNMDSKVYPTNMEEAEKDMKITNIKNVDDFFKLVDQCKGTVELVSAEGDRINLKSKLSQYLSMATVFSNGYIKELELVAHEPEDVKKLMDAMYDGKI